MRAIDVHHLGREKVIACWQVGDILVDPGPQSCEATLMAALGDERPQAVLLTHIHFDHAGATGALVRRWPDLEVYVHERGARHLADPERLVASALRLYGDDFDRLWGDVVPVPAENLRPLAGGETVRGAFRVAYTPGHASHHVAYLHEDTGTAFVGDVAGVRIPPSPATMMPTPPPDIDVELWHESLATIAAWGPTRLALTHFGPVDEPAEQIATAGAMLDREAEIARVEPVERFVDAMAAALREDGDEATAVTFEQAAPLDQLWAGLQRYWQKRAEREGA